MGILKAILNPGPKEKMWWKVALVLLLAMLGGCLVYPKYYNTSADWLNEKVSFVNLPHFYEMPFKLGLDLKGGTQLVYQADLSQIESTRRDDSMSGVRDVIEQRVNVFGVSEPLVQVSGSDRLIVELAGITDIQQAITMIGETPTLDFREERTAEETDAILQKQKEGDQDALAQDAYYKPTQLTGKYLIDSQVTFDQFGSAQVSLKFNDEGREIFSKLTKDNVGKTVAIYLDNEAISKPRVNEEITSGDAVISGTFSTEDAKQLSQRLRAGALPVPISLMSQQNIGASLGKESLEKSLFAGFIGLLIVMIFMIMFYRLSGIVASVALLCYSSFNLAIFKLSNVIPQFGITLTLAGIAGFILSIGMAVDANVLIFERLKEELALGKSLVSALDEAFKRAWPSIFDGSFSTIITCLILYFLTSGTVKGFAITLMVGVLMSLVSAVFITKIFMKAVVSIMNDKNLWLFGKKTNNQ